MIYLSLLTLFFSFIQSFSYLTFSPKLRCHHMVSRTQATSIREEESITLTKKPVVLLDVDGVINCFKSIWPDEKKIKCLDWDIRYSPTVVDKINSWNKVASVKWLTTWNNHARVDLAPALGLDSFENARLDKYDRSEWGKVRSAYSTATNLGDDGIVIWIDDELSEFKKRFSNYVDRNSNISYYDIFQRPNTFLVKPDEGMTPEHVAFIDCILNGSYDKMIYNPNETVCFPKDKFK
jgi:hypothetical protein